MRQFVVTVTGTAAREYGFGFGFGLGHGYEFGYEYGHGYRFRLLSAPAFRAAPGVPASLNQRGRSVVAGRAPTTLIKRAAASSIAGRP